MISPEELFKKHRGGRVLMDANLLLLYLIGSFQRERIASFKRTAQFTTDDFDLLSRLLVQFQGLVTTPHILTEVSNLANSLPEYLKSSWSDHFATQITNFFEHFSPAAKVSALSAFHPFGLTDAAIQEASEDILVLTEDFRLSGYLDSVGVDTLNFRDIALTM